MIEKTAIAPPTEAKPTPKKTTAFFRRMRSVIGLGLLACALSSAPEATSAQDQPLQPEPTIQPTDEATLQQSFEPEIANARVSKLFTGLAPATRVVFFPMTIPSGNVGGLNCIDLVSGPSNLVVNQQEVDARGDIKACLERDFSVGNAFNVSLEIRRISNDKLIGTGSIYRGSTDFSGKNYFELLKQGSITSLSCWAGDFINPFDPIMSCEAPAQFIQHPDANYNLGLPLIFNNPGRPRFSPRSIPAEPIGTAVWVRMPTF